MRDAGAHPDRKWLERLQFRGQELPDLWNSDYARELTACVHKAGFGAVRASCENGR